MFFFSSFYFNFYLSKYLYTVNQRLISIKPCFFTRKTKEAYYNVARYFCLAKVKFEVIKFLSSLQQYNLRRFLTTFVYFI